MQEHKVVLVASALLQREREEHRHTECLSVMQVLAKLC